MSAEWWIRENDSVDGPYQAREFESLIKDGKLTLQTELRLERTTQWTTADKLPWLKEIIDSVGEFQEEPDPGGAGEEELTGDFGVTDTSLDPTSHIVLGGPDERGTGTGGRTGRRHAPSVVTLATWGLFSLSIVVVVAVMWIISTGEDGGVAPQPRPSPGPKSSLGPVAVADEYDVDKGKQIDGPSVLTNDTVDEGENLSAVLVSDVSSGTLDLESDGTFRYEHDDSETTSDRFTYKANDGSLDSNTVTVTITVIPPPILPGDIIRDVNDEERNTRAIGLVQTGWHGTDSGGDVFDRKYMWLEYTKEEAEQLPDDTRLYGPKKSMFGQAGPVFDEFFLGGTGTCFLISPDGYAITNKHVIEDYTKIQRAAEKITAIKDQSQLEDLEARLWVFLDGDPKTPHLTEVVFESTEYDLAILKISGIQDYPFYRLHSGESIPRATEVFVLGFPGAARDELNDEEILEAIAQSRSNNSKEWYIPADLKYLLHKGTVSVVAGRSGFGLAITHTADVNSGNSGGPLMTKNGCVVGINTLSHRGASGIFISLAVSDEGVIKEIQEEARRVELDEQLD